ncbi:gamma-glutamyl-gamma-aminobutyrate hydrolase family protein [Halanaerobaculum tunisiense]
MKPLIGITNYYVDSNELGTLEDRSRGFIGQDMAMCTMDYPRGIKEAGGVPVLLSNIVDEEYIANLVDRCDGFLFSGGADLDPLLYEAEPAQDCGAITPARDQFELKLLDKVIQAGKPILGICRGLQLINVYYNGTLYQDLDHYQTETKHHQALEFPKWYQVHEVELRTDSHLAQAFGREQIRTNSLHHQVIKEVGDNLEVTAIAADGVIEAIEQPGDSFLVAVQWHPEMMFEEIAEQTNLFKYFIDQVKK